MPLTIDLRGRTALVTGAGKGVGQAICHAFATAGASVVVNDYVAARAQSVVDELHALGAKADALPFDVSDYHAVTDAISTFPNIDILVNNAGNAGAPNVAVGGTSTGPGATARAQDAPSVSVGFFAESDPPAWDRYFAVNLFGVMHCSRAVLPGMIEHAHGRIITIISEAARWGEPRMAPYAAAKAAAGGFTRALAREVGRNGITVNNVALATIDTMGLEALAEESEEVARRIESQLRHYIIRRLGQPEDVAGLVAFLASARGEWITGQTYAVNGGYTVNQ